MGISPDVKSTIKDKPTGVEAKPEGKVIAEKGFDDPSQAKETTILVSKEAVTSETEATSVKDLVQPSESVKLVVVKARKLEKQKFGKPDPYVVLTYGAQVEKSKVIKGNLKPEWNLEKVFDVTAKSPKEIIIEVYDKDTVT